MKKTSLILVVILLALVALSADAKNDKKYAPPSEDAVENGIYDVEGRPDMKVKVFVYKARPGKPGPIQPNLVCGSASLNDPDSSAVVSNFKTKLPSLYCSF